jgi:hypothetical protein
MEGMGGDLSLYCDIIGGNVDGVRFPGYEII